MRAPFAPRGRRRNQLREIPHLPSMLVGLPDDPIFPRPLRARRRRRPARIQRPHDPDPGQHGVATVLGDRREPSRCAGLAVRQLGDVVAGVAQGAQLAAIGQRDRVVEGAGLAFVRHRRSRFARSQPDRVHRVLPMPAQAARLWHGAVLAGRSISHRQPTSELQLRRLHSSQASCRS
jgi:hypothetical protein